MASLLRSILLLIQLSGQILALPRNDEPPALTATSISTQTSLELPYETLALREEKHSTNSSFTLSCWDIDIDMPDGNLAKNDGPGEKSYKNSPRLAARCLDLNGKTQCTSISLGLCIANRGGLLKWVYNGDFHSSCQDCGYERKAESLMCKCHMKDAATYLSAIHLPYGIRNKNGRLACGKIRSEGDHCPPERKTPK